MTPVANGGKIEPAKPPGKTALIVLLELYTLVSCVSLVLVHKYYGPALHLTEPDTASVLTAAARIVPFVLVSILFAFAHFSFGYVASFGFYTIIIGYLWLSEFSSFHYNHTLAFASTFASGLAFFLPALFITSPIRQRFVLTAVAFDRLLSLLLLVSIGIIAAGAAYNFQFVAVSKVDVARNQLAFPAWLSYLTGIASTVLLPFAFACFVLLNRPWRAGLSLVLLLLFFPITLSKIPLLAPAFLLFLALISRFASARITIVLSLLLPTILGVLLAALHEAGVFSYARFDSYFNVANFRMLALTSSALDVYNDFFSSHRVTLFCQIGFVKRLITCPYDEPLGTLMSGYRLGNFNASLLATEGIASVGAVFAPLSVFACGLVIALGNRLSSGLPARLVLVSSGLLLQVLMNVPLTIAMVTYGGAILFLLWYLTPRSLFEPSVQDS
jgi:hypothetical protein